jgi:3-dehydro-4-phosphotetronate decarboxylase
MTKKQAVTIMAEQARSLFDRDYAYSTGSSISHRTVEGMMIGASNTSFGRLTEKDFVFCNLEGAAAPNQDVKPSNEAACHGMIYRRRPDVNAILHLHSLAGLTLSTLASPTDTGNVVPVISPGSVTRVGRVPLLEYIKPGHAALPDRVGQLCQNANAILLQNQGLLTFAPTIEQAADIAEEFEQNVRAYLKTGGQARVLDDEQMKSLKPLYGAAIPPGMQRPQLLIGVTLFLPR